MIGQRCCVSYVTGIPTDIGLHLAKGVVYLTSPGFQLILAYIWARPAIFVAGKGRGGRFLFLQFLHFRSFSFLPCPSLSSPLLSLFSLSLVEDTK